jgi:hypothetical protein
VGGEGRRAHPARAGPDLDLLSHRGGRRVEAGGRGCQGRRFQCGRGRTAEAAGALVAPVHRCCCPAAAPRRVPAQRQQRLPQLLALARRAGRGEPDQRGAFHSGIGGRPSICDNSLKLIGKV